MVGHFRCHVGNGDDANEHQAESGSDKPSSAGIFTATSDRKNIIIDCEKMRVADLSGIEALNNIAEKYQKAGKNLKLRHLSLDCRAMLNKAGSIVSVEVLPDDPEYSVARLRADA